MSEGSLISSQSSISRSSGGAIPPTFHVLTDILVTKGAVEELPIQSKEQEEEEVDMAT